MHDNWNGNVVRITGLAVIGDIEGSSVPGNDQGSHPDDRFCASSLKIR